jgi:hypothetical protein
MDSEEKMTDKKVDEEWKKRATEEKEEAAGSGGGGAENFPEADFRSFISGMATQVLLSMGEVENPMTKEVQRNLPQAKYTIDMIQILKDKTAGNLSEDEQKYLDAVLYDLRMRYVEVCR